MPGAFVAVTLLSCAAGELDKSECGDRQCSVTDSPTVLTNGEQLSMIQRNPGSDFLQFRSVESEEDTEPARVTTTTAVRSEEAVNQDWAWVAQQSLNAGKNPSKVLWLPDQSTFDGNYLVNSRSPTDMFDWARTAAKRGTLPAPSSAAEADATTATEKAAAVENEVVQANRAATKAASAAAKDEATEALKANGAAKDEAPEPHKVSQPTTQRPKQAQQHNLNPMPEVSGPNGMSADATRFAESIAKRRTDRYEQTDQAVEKQRNGPSMSSGSKVSSSASSATTDVIHVGRVYSAKASDGSWWPVTITGKNKDGTLTATVKDGYETKWKKVHVSNIRVWRQNADAKQGGLVKSQGSVSNWGWRVPAESEPDGNYQVTADSDLDLYNFRPRNSKVDVANTYHPPKYEANAKNPPLVTNIEGQGNVRGVFGNPLPWLVSYWDDGKCGRQDDDYNKDWCIQGSSFACAPEVNVDKRLCRTGKAEFMAVRGDNTWNRAFSIDGCKYAFFAQYRCQTGFWSLHPKQYCNTTTRDLGAVASVGACAGRVEAHSNLCSATFVSSGTECYCLPKGGDCTPVKSTQGNDVYTTVSEVAAAAAAEHKEQDKSTTAASKGRKAPAAKALAAAGDDTGSKGDHKSDDKIADKGSKGDLKSDDKGADKATNGDHKSDDKGDDNATKGDHKEAKGDEKETKGDDKETKGDDKETKGETKDDKKGQQRDQR